MSEQSNVVPAGNTAGITGMHWVGYSPRADQRKLFNKGPVRCFPVQWNPGSMTWTDYNKQDVAGSTYTQITKENGYYWIEPIEPPSFERMHEAREQAEGEHVNQD